MIEIGKITEQLTGRDALRDGDTIKTGVIERIQPQYADAWPAQLDSCVRDALVSVGILQPYQHQADAIVQSLDGGDVAPPSETAQEGPQSLPSRKRGVDGALTTQPMALAVPPVRSTSASSMQSPPASADATRVSILSPVFARPGTSPRSTWLSTSSRRPRCWARVTRRSSPALATRRWSSKAIWIRSGRSSGSIYSVPLVSGWFSVSKTIIPEAQEHFLTPLARRDTHPFGGLGLSRAGWSL